MSKQEKTLAALHELETAMLSGRGVAVNKLRAMIQHVEGGGELGPAAVSKPKPKAKAKPKAEPEPEEEITEENTAPDDDTDAA